MPSQGKFKERTAFKTIPPWRPGKSRRERHEAAITACNVRGNTFCIYNTEIRFSFGDTQSGFVVAGVRARSDGLRVLRAVMLARG